MIFSTEETIFTTLRLPGFRVPGKRTLLTKINTSYWAAASLKQTNNKNDLLKMLSNAVYGIIV